MYSSGRLSTSHGLGASLFPVIGIMLIDSMPPAMMMSAAPDRMRSAARAIAWRPDEQNRLMVMAGPVSGRPARRATARAMFMPASPSGKAHPRITSST